ncbi:MAG TPA: phytanoyl-CoA dioxygenase family protein [Pseudomonadales bacterium]
MGRASEELAKRTAAGQPSRQTASPAANAEPMARIWNEIRRLGLEDNIAELEMKGLTVVPPEKAAPSEFIDRLRAATIRFIERQDGRTPDFETGSTHKNQILGDYHYLILHDPVFQEALCQPAAVALVDYLLGESCIVHAHSALCKGPHDELIPGSDLVLPLHSDSQLLPGPFHPFAEFANVTWALSDYSKEAGALAYVPGSHLLCRHPLPGEGVDRAVAVEAPAGSIICWHGNTWHGAFRRTIPGLRLSVACIFSRPYIWPRHPLREDVTQEILDANPPRFAKFCGRHVMTGWREEGPDYAPGTIHAYPTRFH